jgi:hypothetical protein
LILGFVFASASVSCFRCVRKSSYTTKERGVLPSKIVHKETQKAHNIIPSCTMASIPNNKNKRVRCILSPVDQNTLPLNKKITGYTALSPNGTSYGSPQLCVEISCDEVVGTNHFQKHFKKMLDAARKEEESECLEHKKRMNVEFQKRLQEQAVKHQKYLQEDDVSHQYVFKNKLQSIESAFKMMT